MAQTDTIFSSDNKSDVCEANKICIQNISKRYYSSKTKALDNVSLDIKINKITVLLGNNGAGKSTLIKILIGVLKPDSGHISLLENNVYSRFKYNAGFCPQENILFQELSVIQHLYFFCKLRGMIYTEKKSYINQLLEQMSIKDKKHSSIRTLSGGMKRKLCIGLAFLSQSNLIILDEPTSGVDPNSRRDIWDMLFDLKKGKTILLSTHFMDEADILGDNIAIIKNGVLQKFGTSDSLKQKFASGTKLILSIDNMSDSNIKAIMDLIKSVNSDLYIKEKLKSSIIVQLNENFVKTTNFVTLLESLEKESISLGITDITINNPSIEEVFLNICSTDFTSTEDIRDTDNLLLNDNDHHEYGIISDPITGNNSYFENIKLVDTEYIKNINNPFSIFFYYLKVFLLFRYKKTIRHYKFLIKVFVTPLLFIVTGLLLLLMIPNEDMVSHFESNIDRLTTLLPQQIPVSQNNIVNQSLNPILNYIENQNDEKNLFEPYSSCPILQPRENICIENKMNLKMINEMNYKSIYLDSENYNYLWLAQCNMADHILNTKKEFTGDRAFSYSFENDIIQRDLNESSATLILHDRNVYQAAPISVSTYNNLILSSVCRETKNCTKSRVNGKIFRYESKLRSKKILRLITYLIYSILSVLIMFGYGVFFASISSFILENRINGIKYKQFLHGMPPIVYILGNFIVDYLIWILILATSFGLFYLMKFDLITYPLNLKANILALSLYGFSSLAFTYNLAYLFNDSNTGFFVIMMINFGSSFISVFIFVLTFKLKPHYYSIVMYSLSFIPQNNMTVFLLGLVKNYMNHLAKIYKLTDTVTKTYGPFDFPVYSFTFISFAVSGLFYFFMNCIFDYYGVVRYKKTNSKKDDGKFELKHTINKNILDTDQINNNDSDNEEPIFEVSNVTKTYTNLKNLGGFTAVNNLSFSVKNQECFGLLGINGAGKSTSFKIFTFQTKSSKGHVTYKKPSDSEENNKFYLKFGYCPQFDNLDLHLTPREHMVYFSRISKIEPNVMNQQIEQLLSCFSLKIYENILCGKLSLGNRRKLSTALALIGDPSVIFLDEPTTGMDPASRRFLWNIIIALKRRNKGIILTSHNMHECEVLCDKIGIMINGQLKCVGSPSYLKNYYGSEYQVIIKCGTKTIANVITYCEQMIPELILQDRFLKTIRFIILNEKLSFIYKKLQTLSKEFNITFTVVQSSLDQVFIQASKME